MSSSQPPVKTIYPPLKVGGLGLAIILSFGCQPEPERSNWKVYKADNHSSSYSGLEQINKQNVEKLQKAWTYRTDDLEVGGRSTMETNPIIVDDVLYGASPNLNVFAIDATTGEELWMYKTFPKDPVRGYIRAVTYWEDGEDKRILFSAGNFLFAIEAETGESIEEFGNGGQVNLNEGLGRDPGTISVKSPSPGIINEDLIIMGSAVGESYDSAPGHIRAYNVRTGRQEWIFHTIPQPGQPGYETWDQAEGDEEITGGGVNNWAGMSLDPERGIVYIPLGSPTYDFYGGDRPGKNLYGNALVALDASTGEHIWHYQTVHHDLWDYDLPAPPNLLTVRHNGQQVDAVAQITKTGFTFVFDRETGEPLFDIEERPVPQSDVEGEQSWPTQPYPVAPEPFIRQNFTEEEITNVSEQAHDFVLALFKKYRAEGLFTPPSLNGSIFFPSTRGGANWGGAAHDPESGVLYINANETPEVITLERLERGVPESGSLFEKGQAFYQQSCASCHGVDLEGQHPLFPGLNNITEQMSGEEVLAIVEEGGGRMPAFTNISDEEKEAIIAYLFDQEDAVPESSEESIPEQENSEDGRFINETAYRTLEGPNGFPAIEPPWGTLNAINLNTGEIQWRIPMGTHPDLAEENISPTGMESWGGPIVTKGGLVFIGGTRDKKFRAFDKDTGELLWETTLSTGGFATPSSYSVNGKQYVVIAAGGGRGTESGDYYVAFSLPGQE